MNLRWRFTVFYTALMAVLFAVVFVSLYFLVQGRLYNALETELRTALTQLVKLNNETKASNNTERATTKGVLSARDWDSFPYNLYGQVLQFTNESIQPSDLKYWRNRFNKTWDSRSSNLESQSFAIFLNESAYKTLIETGQYRGPGSIQQELLPQQTEPFQRVEVIANSRTIPAANGIPERKNFSFVARDFGDTEQFLSDLRLITTLAALLGVFIAGLGAYSLAGRALEPLRDVRDAAANINSRNLSIRLPVLQSQDEVADLTSTLNGMLERLERSFETQRRFTADASHELRTPITAIFGHVNYLLRRTNPSENQRESLEVIRNDTERLSRLVSDLLDLARADAGFPIEPKPIDLVAVAEDFHREVILLAKGAEIHVGGDPNVRLVGDANRLRQVMQNLVSNALKAGATNVLLDVRYDNRNTPPNAALLQIIDNGPGIPEEHLPKLFDRFYRVDTARNRAAGGSGLGLSIVRWIVDAHFGTVSVDSQPNQGTRFVVRLPLQPPNQSDLPAAPAPKQTQNV